MGDDDYNLDNFNRARQTISTSISTKLWSEAKRAKISWSDALEFGIQFLIADKDGVDYPESNLSKKIAKLAIRLNELCLENEQLKNHLGINEEAAVDDILKGKTGTAF